MRAAGYVPLELSGHWNADLSGFEEAGTVPLGSRRLHGLPFRFGSDRCGPCILDLGVGTVRVPVPADTRWIVFAHAVLENRFLGSGAVGETLGFYDLLHADGGVQAQPIRQRFEIGPSPRRWAGHPIPLDWGQTPFLAVPETEQRLMPRTHGRYDEAGARLVEIDDPQARVPYMLPYRFYLFALENGWPDRPLEALRMRGTGGQGRIVVGAITVSDLPENPFDRGVAEDILITLDRPVAETVGLSVDRGEASYLYPALPPPGAGVPGWGAPPGPVRHGYARVAAVPSATLALHDGPQEIARCRFGALDDGPVRDRGVTFARVNRDRTWLGITVRDAADGRRLPCRIHLRTAAGIPCPPYGHHAPVGGGGNTWNLDIGGDVRLGALSYAVIDGHCEGWVPVGEVIVEAACGFDYRPLRRTVAVTPGMRHLDLALERIAAPAGVSGWVAADTHLHFLSSQGALHEARAEGVGVANLLLSQWGHLFTSTEEFTGAPVAAADGRTLVFAGQENRSNRLGHIHLLGMDRPIRPWCTGGAEEAAMGGGLETTLSHWADECHAAGGIVIGAHFPVPDGEMAALVATGRLDAVEMIAFEPHYLADYYRYLDAGYRLALVGGTDKMTAEVAVGQMRTCARLDPDTPLDYRAWLSAIRSGACYATSGPLLSLAVQDAGPGETRILQPGARVALQAEAASIFPLETLELVANGRVVASATAGDGAERLRLAHPMTLEAPTWVAARAFAGPSMRCHHDVWARPIMAHSTPVYLGCGAPYARHDTAALHHMRALCEGVRLHVCRMAATRWPGAAAHRHGEADHRAHLLRPIDEALAAIRARLATGR